MLRAMSGLRLGRMRGDAVKHKTQAKRGGSETLVTKKDGVLLITGDIVQCESYVRPDTLELRRRDDRPRTLSRLFSRLEEQHHLALRRPTDTKTRRKTRENSRMTIMTTTMRTGTLTFGDIQRIDVTTHHHTPARLITPEDNSQAIASNAPNMHIRAQTLKKIIQNTIGMHLTTRKFCILMQDNPKISNIFHFKNHLFSRFKITKDFQAQLITSKKNVSLRSFSLNMNILYPLKFQPKYFEKIWGGQNIKTLLHKDFGDLTNCGEMWLLSGVEGENSVVCNGNFEGDEINDLVETFMGDLVGENVFDKYGETFPLLIKVIDPLTWLSVQVHPDDDIARKIGLENGKTEMWYVMNAEENAELVTGFNREVTKAEVERRIYDKSIGEVLNFEKADKGDVFFIPARRIHALGPGCMVAEIQQTSDTTYRVYDWDRLDQHGMYRELHIPQSLYTLDYKYEDNYRTEYQRDKKDSTVPMVQCPFFTTNYINLDATLAKDYGELDSFVILMSVNGSFTLRYEGGEELVKMGECILIPNIVKKVEICAIKHCELLEIYIV